MDLVFSYAWTEEKKLNEVGHRIPADLYNK